MASELCMNCFSVKGQYEVCPFCGYVEGTPPEQPHYLTPGTILGNHFIVGTVIGFGGFGITYKCFDTTLGVIVAVKEFYPIGLVNRAPGERRVGLLSGDKKEQYKERLQRFLMEAQSVAQFGKAKDIVNVYDFFEENGTAYIIMEYIDGVLLKDYLDKQGPMEPEAALSVIMPIIDAVKKIHSKGIIHRDVSPDNIFIASEDTIKIFDFGAAQLNDSKEGMAAETIIKVGYSPIEQYRDKSKQGFFTDVYSVGAIFYQMLTGVKPLESTEREFHDNLKSPRELGVKINANADRAVMEALAVRPELRFQSIQQFKEALENKRAAEYPQEKLKKRKRRRNAIIGIAAMMALAIGIVIGLYSTVLKPENRIFDSTVKAGTTITVWVENEDQKNQIDQLVEDGFRHKKGTSLTDDKKLQNMQQEDENIEVIVEVKDNMEEALKAAAADESIPLPNMFLSDHVSDLDAYKPICMEDNVYASLNPKEYLFMSEYEKQFTGMREMPTGVDTLLLYASQIDYNTNNGLDSSAYNTDDYTVRLSDLVSGDEKGYEVDNKLSVLLATFSGDSAADAMILMDEDWISFFEKKSLPDQEMSNNFANIQKFGNTAKEKKYRLGDTKGVLGSNIIAGVSYRTEMESIKKASKGAKVNNPLINYKTYVVTNDDGKMLVKFSEKYAITGESSADQQTACMRLLWVMMGDVGQQKKTAPAATTYPILKKQFDAFATYNANYKGFGRLVSDLHDCVLIGDVTGEVSEFMSGLRNEKAVTEEEIQTYCEKYQNGNQE
ncbi:MAG: serine/threonine protein kinase [Lachnospiraceae bacterium]